MMSVVVLLEGVSTKPQHEPLNCQFPAESFMELLDYC